MNGRNFLLFIDLDDSFHASQFFTLLEIDEPYALRGTALFAHFGDARADEHTTGRDEHDFVFLGNEPRPDERAVALAALNRNHALRAAAVTRVFRYRRALAV